MHGWKVSGESPSTAGQGPPKELPPFFVEVEGVPYMMRVPPEDYPQPRIIEESNNSHGWKVRNGGPLVNGP